MANNITDIIKGLVTHRPYNTDSSRGDMMIVQTLPEAMDAEAARAELAALNAAYGGDQSARHAPNTEFSLEGKTLRLIFRNEDSYARFKTHLGISESPALTADLSNASVEELAAADKRYR